MTFDPKVLLQAVYGFAAEYSEDKSTQNAAFIIQPSVDLVHFSIEKSGDPEIDDELRPEYDLSELDGGIRGKYHRCGSCELVSKGLNNIPCGLSRCISPRLERPLKYKYTEHAERDAIYRAALRGRSTSGRIMVCPWAACTDCARAIIGCGLKTLCRYKPAMNRTQERWLEEIRLADRMLKEAGIEIIDYDEPLGCDFDVLFNGEKWRP